MAGPPRASVGTLDRDRDALDPMTALPRRVALLALPNHASLDADHPRNQPPFSADATVRTDGQTRTVVVSERR